VGAGVTIEGSIGAGVAEHLQRVAAAAAVTVVENSAAWRRIVAIRQRGWRTRGVLRRNASSSRAAGAVAAV